MTKFLNILCCNNVDVANNKMVYTAMLNEKGTYIDDLTLTRYDANT